MKDLHGILFAYHSDGNLGDLTLSRNTCSLPFGGRYRLIDFMLSNYVNAGISDVGVIVHQNYQSLLDHLGSGKDWDLSRKHGGLRILPPSGYSMNQCRNDYKGNVDALSGVTGYLKKIRQNYVIMGWGDVAVNLPVDEIFQQHLASGADITVVCSANKKGSPNFSNYVELDADGRICDLTVHPSSAGDSLESLETYILSKDLLLKLVDSCASHNVYSFSRGVLQARMNDLKIMPYIHNGYVARFQDVKDYFSGSMELLDADVRKDLFCADRPIRTKDRSNPSTYYGSDVVTKNALVADGCYIEGDVENSILSRGVIVEKGAKVSNCVLMQGTVVKAGANLSCVITDKNVQICENRTLTGHETYPITVKKDTIL